MQWLPTETVELTIIETQSTVIKCLIKNEQYMKLIMEERKREPSSYKRHRHARLLLVPQGRNCLLRGEISFFTSFVCSRDHVI